MPATAVQRLARRLRLHEKQLCNMPTGDACGAVAHGAWIIWGRSGDRPFEAALATARAANDLAKVQIAPDRATWYWAATHTRNDGSLIVSDGPKMLSPEYSVLPAQGDTLTEYEISPVIEYTETVRGGRVEKQRKAQSLRPTRRFYSPAIPRTESGAVAGPLHYRQIEEIEANRAATEPTHLDPAYLRGVLELLGLKLSQVTFLSAGKTMPVYVCDRRAGSACAVIMPVRV